MLSLLEDINNLRLPRWFKPTYILLYDLKDSSLKHESHSNTAQHLSHPENADPAEGLVIWDFPSPLSKV